MNIIIYIILGLIQGFTEPLPISSSGHIIIFKNLLKIDALNNLNFEIFSNIGSFVAIVIIFRKEILKLLKDFIKYLKTKEKKAKENFNYCILIIIGTIPAGIIGLLTNNIVEKNLTNTKFVGFALLITAFFLFLIRNQKGHKEDKNITKIDAIKIGLFQAVALLPGISRSGSTIVGGMFENLKRQTAFKFSFMLYIPITISTMILSVKDIIQTQIEINLLISYIIGSVFAAFTTYFATKWFKNIILNGKLIYFVYYCLIVGILVIIFL